jgi:hypothetical protein
MYATIYTPISQLFFPLGQFRKINRQNLTQVFIIFIKAQNFDAFYVTCSTRVLYDLCERYDV